ncbi:hypothetical protein ACFSJ3_10170 [Corallincola platygyrae]|uniref:PBP domain-containing protein n=1 Tax=Corallincola platygyrae TaxID=1193278 RepID=A0ABW4XQP6_9GAMM
MKRITCYLILICSFLCCQSAAAEALAVVAHPSVKTEQLSVKELKSIFSMRLTTWSEGALISVYVLPKQHKLHESFCRNYLEIFSYQLERSWKRLVYSGFGQAPTQLATSLEIKERVANTPGAIGYIREEDVDDSVKTIRID